MCFKIPQFSGSKKGTDSGGNAAKNSLKNDFQLIVAAPRILKHYSGIVRREIHKP
jgi:hypothetical protein